MTDRGTEIERVASEARANNPWPPFSDNNSVWNDGFCAAWETIRAAISAMSSEDEVRRLREKNKQFADALFQVRDMLIAVHDGLEDEGDRVYLGSSNHAENLHEAWHLMDALKWDEIMEARTALTPNPCGQGDGG